MIKEYNKRHRGLADLEKDLGAGRPLWTRGVCVLEGGLPVFALPIPCNTEAAAGHRPAQSNTVRREPTPVQGKHDCSNTTPEVPPLHAITMGIQSDRAIGDYKLIRTLHATLDASLQSE